jgi:hypothetical protein
MARRSPHQCPEGRRGHEALGGSEEQRSGCDQVRTLVDDGRRDSIRRIGGDARIVEAVRRPVAERLGPEAIASLAATRATRDPSARHLGCIAAKDDLASGLLR